jgi:hypothetical protein
MTDELSRDLKLTQNIALNLSQVFFEFAFVFGVMLNLGKLFQPPSMLLLPLHIYIAIEK